MSGVTKIIRNLIVPLDEDGLPIFSPILPPLSVRPHLLRREWRTENLYGDMHRLAERFRQTLVSAGKFDCRGFNCHDCVEYHESIDQAVSCAIDMKVEFDWVEADAELARFLRTEVRQLAQRR